MNNKRNLLIMIIALSLILILGSSYAYLVYTKESNNNYVINVGTLEVTFVDSETQFLNLTNMYPMTDEEGEEVTQELVFQVKNTGNIEARYNVYLEEVSTNPEFKNHISFITNKNDNGYKEPKIMGYDKYIDLEARLKSQESASYKVKVWLDKDADNTYMNKEFKAKVVIEGNQMDNSKTLYTKINNAIKEHPGTTIEEDGITYLSGSNDDVNYNYVWYSGKLWRITSINSDGTIKMITQDNITAIHLGSTYIYENSAIYEWLNEDFLDTLYNYENIVVLDASWNNSVISDYQTTAQNILPKDTISKGTVGLLDIHEYYMTYKNTTDNGFLFNKTYFWLSNRWEEKQYLHGDPRDNRIGQNLDYTYNGDSVRPVINLKKDTSIEGEGTITNPYRIVGDKENVKLNEKLNTRLSGEYVKFDNEIYRIVGIEDNQTTKLVSLDYIKENNVVKNIKFSSTTSVYGEDMAVDSVAGYLNTTWYNSISENYKKMLTKGTYYLGDYDIGASYKNTICKSIASKTKTCDKVDKIWTGYVGLPRVGEMFAAQYDKNNLLATWLINANSDKKIITLIYTSFVNSNGNLNTNLYAMRPTITLDSNVVITGGDGMSSATAYAIDLS